MSMLSDELLLVRELNCYDALLIKQIGRRFGLSDKSYTGYSKVLASYAITELLEAKWIPHPTKVRGGASVVYLVGKRGKSLMRSNGLGDEVKRFDFGHTPQLSKHNWHSLYVNWVLLTAHLWAEREGVDVAARMTDFDFKRHRSFPYDVTWGDGTRHGVMMDGLLAFSFEEEDKQFLLEVETGSHAPAAIKEKVKNLVLFIHQGGFQKVFETDLFSSYLFFAMGIHEKLTPDDHRKMILKAIAQQLREMEMEEYSALFRVTSCDVDSPNLFDRPVWYFANDYDSYRLFVDKV